MPCLRAGRAGCGRERGSRKILARWKVIPRARDDGAPWKQERALPGRKVGLHLERGTRAAADAIQNSTPSRAMGVSVMLMPLLGVVLMKAASESYLSSKRTSTLRSKPKE